MHRVDLASQGVDLPGRYAPTVYGPGKLILAVGVASLVLVAFGILVLARGPDDQTGRAKTDNSPYPRELIVAYKKSPLVDKACPLLQGRDAARAVYNTSNNQFSVTYHDGSRLLFSNPADPIPGPSDLPEPLPDRPVVGRLYPDPILGGLILIDGQCRTWILNWHNKNERETTFDPAAALRLAKSLVPVRGTTLGVD